MDRQHRAALPFPRHALRGCCIAFSLFSQQASGSPTRPSGRELLADLLGSSEVVDRVIREALDEVAEALDLHPGFAHVNDCVTGGEGLSLKGHLLEALWRLRLMNIVWHTIRRWSSLQEALSPGPWVKSSDGLIASLFD